MKLDYNIMMLVHMGKIYWTLFQFLGVHRRESRHSHDFPVNFYNGERKLQQVYFCKYQETDYGSKKTKCQFSHQLTSSLKCTIKVKQ